MKAKKIICFSAIAAIIALFSAITIACGIMSGPLTTILCPPNVDSKKIEAQSAEGEALAEKILGEGAVLVKNNGVLPLKKESVPRVNIFGWGSSPHGWVAGGSGSGRVMSVKNDDHYAETNITQAFEQYGIKNYSALTEMYTRFASSRPGISKGTLDTSIQNFYRLAEPDIDDASFYSDDLKNAAKAYSDTAFVVISRIAGEAKDAPREQYKQKADGSVVTDKTRTYLELSSEEEKLVDYVAAAYENVIMIVNSTNTMELGFVASAAGIDACLIVGGTGINAATAIPKIVYGDINPSGRTVDTYAYEFESNINYNHVGDAGEGKYTNGDDMLLVGVKQNAGDVNRHGNSYVDYVENIYVGYKWYETADAEGYWNDVDNDYGQDYYGVVQYPFGYGLSYTDDFKWEVQEVTPAPGAELKADDEITIKVRVTNEGEVAGKEVVQAYFTPRYKPNGIEKASVNLCAFGKTLTDVEPGKNQVVTLKFKAEDMASYDCYDRNNNGNTGFELEAGDDYQIKLMTDSHHIKKVDFDAGEKDVDGVIDYRVKSTVMYKTAAKEGAEVDNKFTGDAALDGVSIDGAESGDADTAIPFVSRASFPKALNKAPDRELFKAAKDLNKYTRTMADDWDKATTDMFGEPVDSAAVTNKSASGGDGKVTADNGNAATELGLALGKDYDDDRWDALLDQVSVSSMKSFLASGDLRTEAIAAIGLPAIENLDGPAQISGFSVKAYRTVGYPTSTVLAQTFNTQLALAFGSALNKEGVSRGVRGWFGPAINIHRTPLGGRNYEYYSEDPYLTGMICAYTVIGAKNAGAYCYLKHLVLYEQETNRESLYTWLTEQSLREVYLKPFKMAVQTGGILGIMTSYNRLGAVWAGGSEALITGVVRNEWGFKGAVITDYSDNVSYMNLDQAVRAGGNRYMAHGKTGWVTDALNSDRFEQRVREGFKQVVYMILNSYYQHENPVAATEKIETADVTPSFRWWVLVLVIADVLALAGCAVWTVFLLRKKKRPVLADDVSGPGGSDSGGSDRDAG